MPKHKTDVTLGDRYRDPLTGIEGTATSVTFWLHGCERVALEFSHEGQIKSEAFDAPRLVHAETGEQPKTTRTGGPGGHAAAPKSIPTR